MKYILAIILFLSIGIGAGAQNTPIAAGVVLDENQQPLIGVTVKEQGTTNGTATNLDGKYSLKLNHPQSKLIITYIGYRPIVIKAEKNSVVNMIPDAMSIDEVVVVGYGTQRKETLIGAISSVKGDILAQTTTSNLTNAIAGRISGVMTLMGSGRPGVNKSELYIRGISSLESGSSSPLVLVDGVERDMGLVDAEDIDSFTVLKDAAATAVYGIRGANGVILVTTKRGETGRARISASVQQSFNESIRIPKILDSYNYAVLRNEALLNDGIPLEYSQRDLDLYRDYSSPYTHPDNNYAADFLRKFSPKTQANINVSGGTDKVRYFISGNFLNERGTLKSYSKVSDLERFDTFNNLSPELKKTFRDTTYDPNPSYNKFSLRTNLDMNLSKTTTLSLDLTARLEKVRNIGTAGSGKDEFFTRILRTAPNHFPYITPNGKYGAQGKDNQSPLVYLISAGYTEQNTNTIEGTLNLKQELSFLVKGLSFSGKLSFDNMATSGMGVNHAPEIGSYSRNGVYSMILGETDWASTTSARKIAQRIVYQLALHYEKSIQKKHNIKGLLLMKRSSFLGRDATLTVYDLDYVGRFTYNYKNKYMFETNMAYNGSSNFSKDKRYGFFPSASIGWNVSEENFWKNNVEAVNFFKLRTSVGEVGNDKLGQMAYFYQNSYANNGSYNFGETSTGSVNNINGFWESQLGNQLVTWERAIKINIGMDVEFLKKFKLTTDFFYEYRYDILAKRNTIPAIYGLNYALPAENLAIVTNRGIEVDLGYKDTFGKLNFWTNLNFTFARNRIKEMDEISYPDELGYKRKTGCAVGTRFGYQTEGFYKDWDDIKNSPQSTFGSPQPGDLKFNDRNGDNKIDALDLGNIGYPKVPQLTGGLTIGCSYKRFSFSMLWQGAAMSTISVGLQSQEFLYNSGNAKGIHENRWAYYTDPLTGTLVDTRSSANYHRLTTDEKHFNHYASTANIVSGNYLRLKDVQLGYTLPTTVVKKIKLSKIALFARINNALLFDHLSDYGLDSEMKDDEISMYPQNRTYTLGMSINF